MTGLLDLPLEVLYIAFRYLREDGLHSTLTVSKRWKDVVEPIAYESIRLSLARTGAIEGFGSLPDRRQAFLSKYAQSLKVMDCWHGTVDEATREAVQYEYEMWFQTMHANKRHRRQWHSDDFLQGLHRLRSFSLERTHINDDLTALQALIPAIRILNTLSTLTHVSIDFNNGGNCDWLRRFRLNHDCWCVDIARLISRVKTLHLRLPYICSRILTTAAVALQPVTIEELIINLSFPGGETRTRAASTGCAQTMGRMWKTLKTANMRGAARDSVASYPCLRTLRIVSYSHSTKKLEAYDAVSDRIFEVSDEHWTEHGVAIDDRVEPRPI